MLEITQLRTTPLVDPHLHIWEWQIAAYLFLGGLVAGLMILNGLWRLSGKSDQTNASTRIGPIWAPILLSVGMFFLWIDLASQIKVYNFYLTFKIRSPMSWGAWILILVYPAQILGIALPGGLDKLPKPLQFLKGIWEWTKTIAQKLSRAILVVNIVLGAMLGIYTGVLLSTFAARPLWNSALLAPLFLVSGLSTAAAWNMLSKPSKLELGSLIRWDMLLLETELAFLVLLLISLMTGAKGHQAAAKLLLGGDFTASFWVIVVCLGIAMPLWLEIREKAHHFAPTWVAPLLILIGGLALRMILVQAGQVSHLPDTEMMAGQLGL